MRFSLPSIKCSPATPRFRLLPSARWSNRCAESRQRTEFGSSRKLGGPAEHLIDGSEKRICRLSFNFRVRVLLKSAVILMMPTTEKKRWRQRVNSTGLISHNKSCTFWHLLARWLSGRMHVGIFHRVVSWHGRCVRMFRNLLWPH